MSHDLCSAERELLLIKSLVGDIERSIERGNADPTKAEGKKAEAIEDLLDIANRAEELMAHIEKDGIPFGRCGHEFCHHCKSELSPK